jgi:Ca2+-binding EF-hand superfamily protein
MTSSPSSLSRYRPAVLVITGAAAAYTAYLIYSTLHDAPAPERLHRSNAVRRPNPRSNLASTIQHLQQHAHYLGEFDFFGNPVGLDARNLVSPEELRDIAQQSQPSASPEMVESLIGQLYDTFLDRLLALTFPNRALSQHETDAVTSWLAPQIPDHVALTQALQRHGGRFRSGGAHAGLNDDGAESIAPTDLSWGSEDDSEEDGIDPEGQTLQRTLYHIAELRAQQDGVIHRGITCNGCDTKPIRGTRWRCANCADFDLCSDCEATNSHIKTHIFYKIRIPAPYLALPKQEPVYPGRPHVMSPSISSSIKKRLVAQTKMDAEEIEALWDQFTCLAGTEWESDPNNIGWAVDRRAFNRAFVPRYSSFITAPNLIYDRIFAYYDTDHNGMIGFEEFIKGLDGMHSRDPQVKLRIVFNGYDVDGDGFISRKDVLRIFRAYYAIEKEATRNYLAESAEELSVRGALETIHSSQPLGSAFTQNSIPAYNPANQRLTGKLPDDLNERAPLDYDDHQDEASREDILRSTDPRYPIQETYHGPGNHIPSAQREQAVRNRWARRQFYIDEEEGLNRPEGIEDTPPASDTEEQTKADGDSPATPEQELPRESRSSSRVRFQDDVDFDTRSNASTSSRPIGERWGGYEIPEPEKDLGKEVLYQITQQAFNELLNPLFQEKEDNAMDAFATRTERRKLAAEIDEKIEEFKREKDLNRTVIAVGTFRYAKWVVESITRSSDVMKELLEGIRSSKLGRADVEQKLKDIFSATEQGIVDFSKTWSDDWEPDGLHMWNAKLCRLQLQRELIDAVLGLATLFQWLPSESLSKTVPQPPSTQIVVRPLQSDERIPDRDPTWPQFRPNSHDNSTSSSEEEVISRSNYDGVSSSSDTSVEENGFVVYADSDKHYTRPDGPFFIAQAQESDDDSFEDEEMQETMKQTTNVQDASLAAALDALGHDSTAEDVQPIQSSTTPPPQSPSPPPLPTAPYDPHAHTNDPSIFLFYIDTDTLTLHAEPQAVWHFLPWEKDTTYKPLERKIRREAMNKDSPLHLTLLASLVTVDKEISERKGSGLLDFEEFGECMKERRLRFLESWWDWVSF